MHANKRMLVGFIMLLLAAVAVSLNSCDILIHRFMPDPASSEKDWSNHFDPFKPAKKGYSVLIDLDSMILKLYNNSKEFKSWRVSGGSKENPSPTGAWVVTEIGNWGGAFGGSWIALDIPWGKYGIHGTAEPWVVGYNNVSHGCIRMKNEDVSELKKYMTVGVPVYINHDNAPFRTIKDGKVGSDVLKLQIMLKKLGYYNGVIDGCFGSKTAYAVCQFQADEQITVDGIIGKQSWDILQKRISKLKRFIPLTVCLWQSVYREQKKIAFP